LLLLFAAPSLKLARIGQSGSLKEGQTQQLNSQIVIEVSKCIFHDLLHCQLSSGGVSKFCLAAEVRHDNQKMKNVTTFDTRNGHSALALEHSLYTVCFIVLFKGLLGGVQMAKCQNFQCGYGKRCDHFGTEGVRRYPPNIEDYVYYVHRIVIHTPRQRVREAEQCNRCRCAAAARQCADVAASASALG
jgi:hypothetical protein